MFEEKKYFCTETENSYTESEMHDIYNEFHDEGETFSEYINSCMVENNGTLITAKKTMTVRNNGRETTYWNIRSEIGRLVNVRRYGCFWEAEDGTLFSLIEEYKSGYAVFCGPSANSPYGSSLYGLKKRISEDFAVLQCEE